MCAVEVLIDFHNRGHQSFEKIIEHCQQFRSQELCREFEGFGYPSLRLQIHHAIGAEKYWIGVLQGRIDVDDDISKYATIDRLTEYRQKVYSATERYLHTVSMEELKRARSMMTWGNNEKVLIPVHVFMRTLTHLYHHQGQISAICRLMGKPVEPGMDYPIT